MIKIDSIKGIIDKYELFLIDLWGVIHDGVELYQGSKDAFNYLINNDKKVVFVSNAPRRVQMVSDSLENMGIHLNENAKVLTSGEVTYKNLIKNYASKATKYFILKARESDLLNGSGFTRTHEIEEADFVLIVGFETYKQTLSDLSSFLSECLKYNKKLICANPDLTVTDIEGNLYNCAGLIAQEYEKMGGDVIYFGKPFENIYQTALSYFPHIKKSNISAIGDNMATDIAGAENINIDSYLIPGGVHAFELAIKHGESPSDNKLQKLFNNYKCKPSGLLNRFKHC